MCSWCWGFAPALEQLQERYTIPLRTVVGGLRTGADAELFPGLLDGFAVDPERYTQVLTDTATLERTRADFEEARSYGVAGFPTLLFRDGHDLGTVTRGFTRGSSSRQR